MKHIAGFEESALLEFCGSCTLPFILQEGEQLGILGTGVLFEHANRSFIVTASHVAVEVANSSDTIALPLDQAGSQVQTIQKGQLWHLDEDQYDVAVIEILDPRLSKTLGDRWRFLRAHNVSSEFTSSDSFLVCGYPIQLTRQRGRELFSGILYLRTTKFIGDIENTKIPVDNLGNLMLAGGPISTLDGTSKPISSLRGVSGGSVWTLVPGGMSGEKEIWHPERLAKLVGVQVSSLEGVYIRCTTWLIIAAIFHKIDKRAENALRKALGI